MVCKIASLQSQKTKLRHLIRGIGGDDTHQFWTLYSIPKFLTPFLCPGALHALQQLVFADAHGAFTHPIGKVLQFATWPGTTCAV